MATIAARPLALALLLAAPLAAANITVNTEADADAADADCSLREAIVAANTNAAYNGCAAGTGTSDRIIFALALPATITLTGDLPTISESIALVGPGVDQLTIDGQDLYALLAFVDPVDGSPWLLVSGLTLTHGLASGSPSYGGALFLGDGRLVLRDAELSSSSAGFGGGLAIYGEATVERCRILDNTATLAGGGGGVLVSNGSSLDLVESTVAGNSSSNSAGSAGGINGSSPAAMTIRSSTISGNSAQSSGGGVEVSMGTNGATTELTIASSTITQNQCGLNLANTACGGGVRLVTFLGGLMDVTMTNSVIAENLDVTAPLFEHDLALDSDPGLSVTPLGFNLIGDNRGSANEFPAGAPNANGDFVGDGTTPIDPQLEALGDNGGPTPTHAFVSFLPHPLVDKGECAGALADQRGYGNGTTKLRIVDLGPVANNPNGDGCDIGAVEASNTALVPSAIFADGFESARLLFWSADTP